MVNKIRSFVVCVPRGCDTLQVTAERQSATFRLCNPTATETLFVGGEAEVQSVCVQQGHIVPAVCVASHGCYGPCIQGRLGWGEGRVGGSVCLTACFKTRRSTLQHLVLGSVR